MILMEVMFKLSIYTFLFSYFIVSIHAPAWGATPIISDCLRHISFQSTLPHGERLRTYECWQIP